jgi:hypothetical protein
MSNLKFRISDINLVGKARWAVQKKKKISDLRFEIANLQVRLKVSDEIESLG